MKKFLSILTACSALTVSAMLPLSVHAADADVTVSIDQKEVSMTELKKSNYEVPVFVRLEQNVNLNAVEFGVDVDSRCRFEVVTRNEYAQIYGEGIQMEMACASVPGTDSFAWLTWASTSVYYQDKSNIVLLLVKIPESANVNDVYELHYLTESPSNENKKQVWYNFGTNTDYAKTGSIMWNDGSIKITAPVEEEPEILSGDANLDGVVNILDAITVNRAVLGKESLDDNQKKAADLNESGVVDSTDSLMIIKMIVGITE